MDAEASAGTLEPRLRAYRQSNQCALGGEFQAFPDRQKASLFLRGRSLFA